MTDIEQNLVKSVRIGDRLRQARTSAGLEISDIATDLRINPGYIEALELNQFQEVGAPTYVKGYLRSYANALKLSPEALIEEYEGLGYETPNLNAVSPLESIESNNKLLHLFSLLVVFVTLGLFIYWLINSGYNNDYSAQSSQIEYTEPQTSLPLVEASTRLPLVSSDQDEAIGAEEVVPAVSSDDLLSVPLVSEPQAVEVVAEQVTGSATALDEANMVAGMVSSTTEVQSVPTRTFSEADLISATEGSDEIILTLSAESWIEIEDATHFQLMIGVYPEGTSKILRGQAPFQVFLGYAPGVEIIFNESVYQSAPHMRANNTAKFALVN